MDGEQRHGPYDLLTVRECAEVLRCSETTVRRAVREGRIIWFRVRPRGHIRIPFCGVEQMIRGPLLEAADEATRGTSAAPW